MAEAEDDHSFKRQATVNSLLTLIIFQSREAKGKKGRRHGNAIHDEGDDYSARQSSDEYDADAMGMANSDDEDEELEKKNRRKRGGAKAKTGKSKDAK